MNGGIWVHFTNLFSIDFERGFISFRDPKGRQDQKIPLNDGARRVLQSLPRGESPYVFPGREGKQRTDINKAVKKIKETAGLPKEFRAIHGLRHDYASMLASSGKVDVFTLQKLLTHKSAGMTKRYAHLRDEALRRASELAGNLVEQHSSMSGDEDKAKLQPQGLRSSKRPGQIDFLIKSTQEGMIR